MRITGLQWDLIWENREANYTRARDLLRDAKPSDLIVLPEMFSSGFSMNVEATAEPDDLPSEAFLRELAKERDALAIGGLVRRGEEKGCNELIAIEPDGSELGRYRKNRTFRYTGESEHYENGSDITVFEWWDWKIAPLICYDLRFPELFRRATARGAELIIVIASWPTVRVDHWLTLLRARAIENLAYVVGVNRTGADPSLDYPGRSVVIDPWGEIIADAGADDGLVEAEIDLEKVRSWRDEFPALLDLEV